jgi:CRISPR-associated protein Cmr3
MSGTTHHLALVPRDGFFVKDGRGWQTSARTSVLDWPWPTTVRGALTTVSGKIAERQNSRRFVPRDWQEHQKGIAIGATVALRRTMPDGKWSAMWPVPADTLWLEDKNKVLRLKPAKPQTSTLGRAASVDAQEGYAEAREALWVPQIGNKAKPLPRPRWLDNAKLARWLAGKPMEAQPRDRQPRMASRLQAHVSIRPETLTGDDGMLFAHEVIETLESLPREGEGGTGKVAEWAIGVEVKWPVQPQSRPDIARLGSDSRLAWIEQAGDDLFKMPADVQEAFGSSSKGLRLVVVTPACFAGGWLPDGFAPVKDDKDRWVFRGQLAPSDPAPSAAICETALILRAAFVPRPMHISGWDVAENRPKPTSRLVPPGAVYFFERADSRDFTADDAKALWLAALGGRANEGFGRIVPGIWDPQDTECKDTE